MKPQFLCQIIQSRHTLMVMFLQDRTEGTTSKEILCQWEAALNELDSLIKAACTELNEPLVSNPAKLQELPQWEQIKDRWRKCGELTFDNYSTEKDHEIPESIWQRFIKNEELLRQKWKEHLSALEKLMKPPLPSVSPKIAAEARRKRRRSCDNKFLRIFSRPMKRITSKPKPRKCNRLCKAAIFNYPFLLNHVVCHRYDRLVEPFF